MSRPRKPTHLRLIEGDKSRRGLKAARTEPVPRRPLGDPPEWFTDEEREIWDELSRELPPGMLKRVDSFVVEMLCTSMSIWRKARRDLYGGPRLIKVGDGGAVQQSPHLSIMNGQNKLIRSLCGELGLSPAARTRISVGDGDGDADPADRFFD